jgi:hypothetical protein
MTEQYQNLFAALAKAQGEMGQLVAGSTATIKSEKAAYSYKYDDLLVATRIENAVKAGVTPEQIYRHILSEVGEDRQQFALRCKQAAQHLAGRG